MIVPVVAALLLAAALPLPAAAQTAALPPLGMDTASIADLTAAGAPPRYASYWAGAWMAQYGWGGLDNALRTAKASGTTPIVHWWYWGDMISDSCVENGCGGRSQAQWTQLTGELAERVRTIMGGQETLIVLENEFNKDGIAGPYAPTFDAKLEAVAKTLRGVQGVRLVLGFGAWNEAAWDQFPRSAAQSDYIGFQMMRGSTRHTEAEYRDASARVSYYTGYIAKTFGKPSFLYDLALSSYPDASWERTQGETLQAIFDQLVGAGQTGLQGVVYRSLKDHYMDPANYFGAAESHWGLKRSDGSAKPAWGVWMAEAGGLTPTSPPPPPAPAVPARFEAEALSSTAGGRVPDAAASGGAVWNLWSNGESRADVQAAGAFDARITVTARGDWASGVAPRMEVRLGTTVLASFDVASGALRAYTVDARIPDGASRITVAFTNDARTTTEDRNLILDVVDVARAPVNAAPSAAFTASGADLSWGFDARASSDPEGAALSYAWEFGDGATASGATASHAYASSGPYTVKLTVSDGALSSSATSLVTATRPNSAPTARIATSGADLAWSFDASASTDLDGDALAYSWALGDGATASGARVAHAYAAAGPYVVTLTVSDGRSSSVATASVTATRPNQAPVARASTSGANLSWAFDGAASTDPDGDALSWSWSFGDGSSASGANVTHAYRAAGTYTVTLNVTDARGLASSTSLTVTAKDPPPVAFNASFSGASGNAWWVQVNVLANKALLSVCASVDGGACRALVKQAWGAWAASFLVPAGADVTFRATSTSGETVTSIAHDWPSGAPALRATFSPYGGNAWWVQAKVDANAPLRSVCATVNGGTCQPLNSQAWGAWGASFSAPKGSKVVFVATGLDGQVVRSAAYTWPVV